MYKLSWKCSYKKESFLTQNCAQFLHIVNLTNACKANRVKIYLTKNIDKVNEKYCAKASERMKMAKREGIKFKNRRKVGRELNDCEQ